MTRPIDVVRKVAPRAKPNYLAACENSDALLRQHGITTPNRLAHFLAQVMHETGGLVFERESMNYSAERLMQIFGVGKHSAAITQSEAELLAHNQSAIAERVYGLGNPAKAAGLGNTQPGDGFRYRGGGLMQTTGRSNFRTTGKACGVDFEANPDLIVSPQHALLPALVEWTANKLNVFADNDDILTISRAINIGNPKSTRMPNGMADRIEWLARLRPLIDTVDLGPGGGPVVAPPPVEAAPEQPVPAGSIEAILGGKLLQMGDQGPMVRALQLALAKLGYNLKGTGNFGGATDAAVTDFQQQHGLEADGVVGPATARALDAAVARPDAAQPGGARPDAAPPPAPTITGRPLWLVEGMKWIGTEETQGAADNVDIIRWAQDEGGNIAKDFKHDSIPWCSLFANMILTKVGIKGTETLWALDWSKWGVKLPGPAVGAFAPMKRDGGGHIVVVVGHDQHGNLMCLGGNQSDAVNIQAFPRERPLSFRWPDGVPLPTATGFESLPLVKSDGQVSKREA